MPISPDALIANRYKLLDCLGVGGMGEVWKAQDTNFSRLVVVAVKLLKEDDSFAEDARQRRFFERTVRRHADKGELTVDSLLSELDEAFNIGGNLSDLKRMAQARFRQEPLTPESALAFFDDVCADTNYNENARHRRRLRDMFAGEANAVAVLQHANIVRVTDYGEQDGVPFLVMDFIDGRTLQQVIHRKEPMPLTRRLRLMEDLCEGLGYAHRKQLVHRDIKPANLIIDTESERLKILDFGIARTLEISAQRTQSRGVPIGTYCYMSPEQTRAARSLDNRSDIFSVGLVFYEFLTFQRAFPSTGNITDLIERIQRHQPQPLRELLPDLDPEVERIVYRAIEKQPSKRYQDLSEMHRDIEGVRAGLESAAKRPSQASRRTAAPKNTFQQIADLLDRAQLAFEGEDDRAVLQLCSEIEALSPLQPDALELKQRAEARLAERTAQQLLAEGQQLIERGDLSRAEHLLKRPELQAHMPVAHQLDRAIRDARRRRYVDRLLTDAQAALDGGQFQDAIRHAEQILDADPANTTARALIHKANDAIERLHEQQVANALAEAQAAADEGRWNDGLTVLSTLADDSAVKARIAQLEEAKAREEARHAAVREALHRARLAIDAEMFADAQQRLAEVREVDATNPELSAIETILAPILAIQDQLRAATSALADGDLPRGEEQLRLASEALKKLPRLPELLKKQIASVENARRTLAARKAIGEALNAPDLDWALSHARAAASQLPGDTEASAAVARIEQAISRRTERAVDDAIQQADALAAERRFDEALHRLSSVAQHKRASARRHELIQERDAYQARQAEFAALQESVRRRVAQGDFAAALSALGRAHELEPEDADVVALQEQLAPINGALAQLRKAVSDFNRDTLTDLQNGLQVLEEVSKVLAPYAGQYPAVRERLTAAKEAKDAAIARREKLELTLLSLVAQLESAPSPELLKRTRDALEATMRGRSEAASGREHEGMVRLYAAEAAIRVRDEAHALAKRGELEAALACFERDQSSAPHGQWFRANHPICVAEVAQIRARIRERNEQQAAERARVAQEQARLAAERAEAEERARQRQAFETRVAAVIASADASFTAGKRVAAIEQLASFTPADPRVSARLAALRDEHERLDREARERQEAERIEAERAAIIAKAAKARRAGNYAAAFEELAVAERLVPAHLGTQSERLELIEALGEAVRSNPRDAELVALQRRHDPVVRRRRLVTQALSAVAAVVAVAGVVLLLQNLPSIQPADDIDAPAPSTSIPVTANEKTEPVPPAPPPPAPVPPQHERLTVNLHPWASVRISAAQPVEGLPADPLVTPFTITLPPGEYRLRAENNGLTAPLDLPITIERGKPLVVSRTMPGFSPDRVVDSLLGPER